MSTHQSPMFRRIGQGFCGSVWAASTPNASDAQAIKREDGGPDRSLHNDYIMHQKVLSFCKSRVRIPRCHQYISIDNQTWWDAQISRFPSTFQPCNALKTDRIPPFSSAARNTIIDKYCPASLQEIIKASEPDQDCLIRPYLGRRRRLVTQSRFHAFSLRNYSLHADQIEELGLDGILYAKIMAETLADLYWRAQIDANDVEFVLAPLGGGQSSHYTTIKSDTLGEHTLWILDFDCCKPMPFDGAGVQQSISAFFRNDPYYPRPGRDNPQDQILWDEFKARFLEASEVILKGSPEAYLPALWIHLAEHRGERREGLPM